MLTDVLKAGLQRKVRLPDKSLIRISRRRRCCSLFAPHFSSSTSTSEFIFNEHSYSSRKRGTWWMRKFVSTWVGFAHLITSSSGEGKSFKISDGVCWWKRCVEVSEQPPFLMLIYSRFLISLFSSSLTTPKCGRQNFPKDHVDVNNFLISFGDQLWWKTRRWWEKLREGFRIHIQLDVVEARNCQSLPTLNQFVSARTVSLSSRMENSRSLSFPINFPFLPAFLLPLSSIRFLNYLRFSFPFMGKWISNKLIT